MGVHLTGRQAAAASERSKMSLIESVDDVLLKLTLEMAEQLTVDPNNGGRIASLIAITEKAREVRYEIEVDL
jgi:hypothetical protein